MHPKNKAGTIPWGPLRPAGDLRRCGAAAGVGASTTSEGTRADEEGGGARWPGGGSTAMGLLR